MLCDASGNVLRVKYIQIKWFSINRPAMFELLSCLSEGRALSPPDRSSVFSLRSSLVFRVAVSSFRQKQFVRQHSLLMRRCRCMVPSSFSHRSSSNPYKQHRTIERATTQPNAMQRPSQRRKATPKWSLPQ